MSTEVQQIKQAMSIIQKLINLYQQLLLAMSKELATGILHWTGTSRDLTSFEAINRGHSRYPISELGHHVAYNYLVTKDSCYQARKDSEEGLACKSYKGSERDVCITGMPDEKMNEYQKQKVTEVFKSYRERGIIRKVVFPHSYFLNTECPGKDAREFLKNLNKELNR